MDNDLYRELQVPCGLLTGINFDILNEIDTEKLSVMAIDAVSEVTHPKLGIPNPSSQCSTCGAKDTKNCEGHFGVIRFPFTILHPYFLSEVAHILNKICPGCKSIRHDRKGGDSKSRHQSKGCKYCVGSSVDWYPTMKFRVSSKDLFRRTAITAEVSEKLPKKFRNKNLRGVLPADYWDFIPKDPQQQESSLKSNKRVLSHAQVHYLLKDVDPKFITEFVSRRDSLFLNCSLVTPNSHRVSEITHALSNGQRLVFDDRTRAYRKLVDFRGAANELGSRVLETLKISKLSSDKSSSKESATNVSGSKWFKEVVLGKRTDHSFRMVVVGDPKIKLGEIGIPCCIAERLQISEHLNSWNWEKLSDCCNLRFLEKGEIYVRRQGRLVRMRCMDKFQTGDTIYRPLSDGDVVLINRPPSIHQHSLIALSVKILPVNSVVSLNPLCCPPLRGDFDGDCLHGYIPQSFDSRVELGELVALNRQLINGQSGRNLLSLTQDSLTAAHLVLENGVLLNVFHMQQLAMFCPRQLQLPAIVKAPATSGYFWTGKQLFSMLLPPGFDYSFPSNDVYIGEGELLTASDGSAWLRDTVGSIFYSLVKHCKDEALDLLHAAQNVLCEWLSMRGLSVSLSDLYLSSDSDSRQNMIDEVCCGLQEADWACNIRQLMVDSCLDFLVDAGEENQKAMLLDVERLCHERQKSAALSQASVCAFKQVFRDIQSLVYQYASRDNSLLVMLKSGSKGNLLKLVQHSMCVGLQHSLVPLSFRMPHHLSCGTWNNLKVPAVSDKVHDTAECAQSFIPYAVVENSFLTGLNPLECFVHSLTCRDSSFSDNADVPGTLSRRLMFFMRDLHVAYDGTVRNAYGNQLVQFSYDILRDASTPSSNGIDEAYVGSAQACDSMAGQPVGSLSACAISEAAYSALDQPISTLEISPLLNLKNVLECGLRKFSANQTASLFLSKKLGRWIYGFEYGALEVKNHLEKLLFSDIVSTVMIVFSPQTCDRTNFSPWVCHFHVCKEIVKRRRLKVHSIIDALHMKCSSTRVESKLILPNMQITSKGCSEAETDGENDGTFCITIAMVENSSKSYCIQLETVRDLLIPVLLGTVVKGFAEIKKVEILWNDRPQVPKSNKSSLGELYLRVYMSENCGRLKLWNVLLNNCLKIADMIDWERSHPDDIHGVFSTYGIDAAWKCFLTNLKSAISDVGKTILPEHLLLVANCLSASGEFVGLNSKGLARQREETCGTSPFVQACFSSPGATFIKAAKLGRVDNLQGSLDALAWGKIPSTGTGGQFDILYSGKGHEIAKPEDIYDLLGRQISSEEQNLKNKVPHANNHILDKCGVQPMFKYGGSVLKGRKSLEKISKSVLRSFISLNDIQRLSHTLKGILHKYPINHSLSEMDKSTLMMALYFHPQRDDKIGIGAQDVKIGYHSEHQNARCFLLVRTDGTVEDFSYHKCVLGALEIIAPRRAKGYQSKCLKFGELDPGQIQRWWDW
ncbi:DNA-directed RNA polymerase IV subunit 1 isoform X2 [Malania oleifera]|uniref:DNA-directed RNA polymerase IV subunit 1 isoform X2 n=1 Tax=Malania oleifera TaxID=397392 RepID=UPI0025AE7D8C|nr:DNA-directed RNA polymerase IV subunit 1 isoform X2 [Malania oleifera]